MTVWLMFGNFTLLTIWDRKPSISDLRKYAEENGWPAEFIDDWKLEERTARKSTAL